MASVPTLDAGWIKNFLSHIASLVCYRLQARVYLIQPWTKNFKPTESFFTYFKYLDVDMDHEDRKNN